MADGNFDQHHEFEYRDLRFLITSVDAIASIGSMGQTQQQNFANVTAIVKGSVR